MIAEPKTPGEMTRMIWREMFGNGHPGMVDEMRRGNEKVEQLEKRFDQFEKRFDQFESKLDDRKTKKVAAWAPYAGAIVSLAIAVIALIK
jgi:hypothetical protein